MQQWSRWGVLCTMVLTVFMLGGCATQTLDAQKKASIRTVAIAKDVELRERPTVFGDKAGGAFLLGGALGAALEQGASSLPDQFLQAMAAEKVDVRSVLRTEVTRQLTAKGYQVVEDESRADAVVRLRILNYGLTKDLFDAQAPSMPLLVVRAHLVEPRTGSELWWGHLASNTDAPIHAALDKYPVQQFLQNRSLLRSGFEKISRLVTTRLAERL